MGSDAGGAVSAEGNPWRSVWFHPQATISRIIATDPTRSVLLLAVLGGIAGTLFQVWSVTGFPFEKAFPNRLTLSLLAFLIAAGVVFGILTLYIDAAFLRWFGILLGGRASQRDLRVAVAWSLVPLIPSLGLMLGLVGFYLWAGPINDANRGLIYLVLGIGALLVVILHLWSLFLLIRGIGAVQKFGLFRAIANFLLVFVVVPLAVLSFRTFAFQPFNIPSGSMAPTLLPGDYLFVSKSSYGYGRYSLPFDLGFSGRYFGAEPKRGDVVVFRLHRDPRVDYVKRIVGLPGDEIAVKDGILLINGQPTPQTPLGEAAPEQFGDRHGFPKMAKFLRYIETLPGGVSYEILRMSGRAAETDTPRPFKVPAGHYFVLGDNRDNSADSRWPQVGFVSHDELVGRVSVIFFSRQEDSAGDIRWDRFFQHPR